MWERSSVADYIQQGWTLSLTTALDFSLKTPHNSDVQPNESEKAFMEVGHALIADTCYSTDRTIDLWGFSGRLSNAD